MIKTIRYIANHPMNRANKMQVLMRFVRWQVKNLIDRSATIVQFAENSRLVLLKGQAGATGNYYCGLHEYEDMAFVLHYTRESDLFVDVGANVGTYTILAASERGARAISFEPVPETYKAFLDNLRINNLMERVMAHNFAVGEGDGEIEFTKGLDAANHVATSADRDTIKVRVSTIDEMVDLDKATIFKIDVEGFETLVLKGMRSTLNSDHLKVVIMELNDSGKRYGFDQNEAHQTMLENGFVPCTYNPENRALIELSGIHQPNTIYVRDKEFVIDRLKSAPTFTINGRTI